MGNRREIEGTNNNDQEIRKMLRELDLMRDSLPESTFKFISSLEKSRKRNKGLSEKQTECLKDVYQNYKK